MKWHVLLSMSAQCAVCTLARPESCAWDAERSDPNNAVLPFGDKLASLPAALGRAQASTEDLQIQPVETRPDSSWTLHAWRKTENARARYYEAMKDLLFNSSLFPGCTDCQESRAKCKGRCEISKALKAHGIHNDDGSRHRPFLTLSKTYHMWIDQMMQHAETVIQDGIPGAFMETGVWRGGMSIAMAAVAAAHCDTRPIFVCDSFKGIPAVSAPNRKREGGLIAYGNDKASAHYLSVPRRFVKAAFRDLGLLSPSVHFVEGYFNETMPVTDPGTISILRLDGDLYSSTMDVLVAQYPRLSPGGFVVIDDYVAWGACRNAVHDYRSQHNITEALVFGGSTKAEQKLFAVYWRKRQPS